MLLPDHDYIRPASLSEALARLHEAGGRASLLAGGTDLIFNMRGMLQQPELLISIRRLPELGQVELLPDGSLRIGAGVRLTDLVAEALLADRYPVLADALRAIASQHVRNLATLGGNLCLDTRCWFTNQSEEWRAGRGPCLKTGTQDCHAVPGVPVCVALNNSDAAPMLIAMNATVTLARKDGRRELPLEDFYRNDGVRHTVLAADEMLTHVQIPPSSRRLVWIKHAARAGMDFAYGTIAASALVEQGRLLEPRLVLGSLAPRPLVLQQPAAIIARRGSDDKSIAAATDALRGELGTLTNLYTPAAYKSDLARMLVKRALERLREEQA